MPPLFGIAALALAFQVVSPGRTQDVSEHPAWLLPGPRTEVGGIDSLTMRSKVVLHAAPGVPWELNAAFAFPDRARIFFASKDEHGSGRTLRYRFGELAPFIPPLESKSVLLHGAERLDSLRRIELRRAVAIWPDLLDWNGTGTTRRANLGPLGSFVAQLDEAGLPTAIECRAENGEVLCALEALQWRAASEPEGRAQLLSLTLTERGVAIWDETVESLATDFKYLDRYFLPGDRREFVSERTDLGRPEPATLPRGTWRRTALAKGADWPAARARADELTRAATAELAPKGLALEPSPAFEVDDSGRPVAVLLELEEAVDDPPKGWRTLPARPGAQVRLRSVRRVRYEELQTLRQTAGGGSEPALMRVSAADSADPSVVVFIAAKTPR